jgi:hypothetical protein
MSLRNRVAQLYPRALGSLFVASYDSQGYGGSIITRLHKVEVKSYITTDSQSASPSWCQAPIWDQRPIFPILFDYILDSFEFVDVGRPL